MAIPLTELLKSVDDKVISLVDLNEALRARVEMLEQENLALNTQLNELTAKLTSADNDIKFLKVSHKLADSPDELIATRRLIARLIRNIDNCISMLKEE